jgi:hypothetical protein
MRHDLPSLPFGLGRDDLQQCLLGKPLRHGTFLLPVLQRSFADAQCVAGTALAEFVSFTPLVEEAS